MVEKKDVPVFKNNPVLVLVLGFVTCGIYMLYWNLKMAEVFNKVTDKQMISPPLAAFGACCFPLNIYFFYLISQRLGDLGKLTGNEARLKDSGTIIIILGIFVAPAAAMIIQGHVNELYEK